MAVDNIKVAVRVRPFTDRERSRNASLVVKMEGNKTILLNPLADANAIDDPKNRVFEYDYSYWSHHGFKETAGGYIEPDSSTSPYCDQKKIFSDLGEGILKNARDGFNSTLFAYGQTGSGKSYSVIGYGKNKGIVPMFCDRLFQDINGTKEDDIKHEVMFSMLEIYREVAHDLLGPKNSNTLQIHENTKESFYAAGLSKVPVASFDEIEKKLNEGAKNRTIAATNMNATSSRSHVVVTIWYKQKYMRAVDGKEMVRESVINLVDLAGSEQSKKTGATGNQLKEANTINLSLTTLGRVIAALAEQANHKNALPPYRESQLTKLLKNSLGGNNKTIMIAAISPADINYDETLSTLRFADGAKRVKNRARMKEDPTDKLIRELVEENDKLRQDYENRMGNLHLESKQMTGVSSADIERIKQQAYEEYQANLAENKRRKDELERSFQERLAETYKLSKENATGSGAALISEASSLKTIFPYLYNLNQDEQLTGLIEIFITKPAMQIGRSKAMDIQLSGASIADAHAVIVESDGRYFIEKVGESREYRTLVNGESVKPKTKLEIDTNSRILFGTSQLFIFVNPKSEDEVAAITYDMAINEIAIKNNYVLRTSENRKDAFLQEEIIELKSQIEDANAISLTLEKFILFELAVIPGIAKGDPHGKTELLVIAKDLTIGHEWLWPQEQFLERKAIMDDMFKQMQETNSAWKSIPKEKDPFWDDPNNDIMIGYCAQFKPLPLVFKSDVVQTLDVIGLNGIKIGRAILRVELHPCDQTGREVVDTDSIQDPKDLLTKDFHFNLKIVAAKHLPTKYKGTYVRFKVFEDTEFSATAMVTDRPSDPAWNYVKRYDWKVEEKHLRYLRQSTIPLQIWGKIDPLQAKKKHDLKADLRLLVQEGITLPKTDLRGQKVLSASPSASDELHKLRHKMIRVNHLLQDAKFQRKSQVIVDHLIMALNDENHEYTSAHVKRNGGGASAKIFVSYSWDHVTDIDVRNFANYLKSLNSYEVWIDENDMQIGTDINEQMANNIKNSDLVLIFFNNHYQKRKNCQKEARLADKYEKPKLFISMQRELPQQAETKLKTEPWFDAIILSDLYISYYKDSNPHKKILNCIDDMLRLRNPDSQQVDNLPASIGTQMIHDA